jgi:hypothetical protein
MSWSLVYSQPFLISGELLPNAEKLWSRAPALAGNVRARSGDPLCRDAQPPPGAHVQPDRETQQPFDVHLEAKSAFPYVSLLRQHRRAIGRRPAIAFTSLFHLCSPNGHSDTHH